MDSRLRGNDHKLSVIALLFGLLFACPAFAQSALPQANELRQTRTQLADSKARSDRLRKNLTETQSALSKLQAQTGAIAALLQQEEIDRQALETKLAELHQDEIDRQAKIDQHRRQIAAMLAAAIRLGQVPPYAALAMEGGIEDQIHASRALAMTSSGLKTELDTLSDEIAQIGKTEAAIHDQQKALSAKEDELKSRRDALGQKLDERKKLVGALSGERSREEQRAAQLAKKSADLESLVATLEAARKKQAEEQAARETAARAAAATAASTETARPNAAPKHLPGQRKEYDLAKARGNLRLPAAGRLIESFGTRRGANDTIRGMRIETAPGAVVTSPFGGEVLFTGPFLDYGPIVIIRHSRQYHTLLAGLSRIDVTPGQFLLEGEPIGVMGNGKEERRLYVELREAGKPIDPAPWFRGFGHVARR